MAALALVSAFAVMTPDQAVSMLPASSETIICSKLPGTLRSMEQGWILRDQLPRLALFSLPDGADHNPWPIEFEFVVEGSRNNRKPTGLGVMPYDGCSIILLKKATRSKIEALARQDSSKRITVVGLQTYMFSQLREMDTWKIYIAFRGDVMFCATDQHFLAEVLSPAKTGSKALSAFSRETPFVDIKSPFWAVRRFTATTRKTKYDASPIDPKRVGYAVQLSADGKRLLVVSISDGKDGQTLAKQTWHASESFNPQFKRLGLHGTQISFDAISKNQGRTLFLIASALGHTIFL